MSVIKQPVVSEKTNKLSEKLNQYVFEVDMKATKSQVKVAIQEMYPDVNVAAVNTVTVASKPKNRFSKKGYTKGRTDVWKKAIVTLKEGDKIDFFSEI
jgi:large subunit ribosomal protein L23